MRLPVVVAAAVLWSVVACDGSTSSYDGGGDTGCTPTATQICMLNTQFNPATKAVSAGTVLTWKNGDSFRHTTTSNASNSAECPTWNAPVDAGRTSPGVTFGTAGVTCAYGCTIHPNMQASVTVVLPKPSASLRPHGAHPLQQPL